MDRPRPYTAHLPFRLIAFLTFLCTVLLPAFTPVFADSCPPPETPPQTDALAGPWYDYAPYHLMECGLRTSDNCNPLCLAGKKTSPGCYQSWHILFHNRLPEHHINSQHVLKKCWKGSCDRDYPTLLISSRNLADYDLGNDFEMHNYTSYTGTTIHRGPEEFVYLASYNYLVNSEPKLTGESLCLTLFPQLNIHYPKADQQLIIKDAYICANGEDRKTINNAISKALQQPGVPLAFAFLPARSGEAFQQIMVATTGAHIETGLAQSLNTIIFVVSPDYLKYTSHDSGSGSGGSGVTFNSFSGSGSANPIVTLRSLSCPPRAINLSHASPEQKSLHRPARASHALIGLMPDQWRPAIHHTGAPFRLNGNLYMENMEWYALEQDAFIIPEGSAIVDRNVLWYTPEGQPGATEALAYQRALHVSVRSQFYDSPEDWGGSGEHSSAACPDTTLPASPESSGSGSTGHFPDSPCLLVFDHKGEVGEELPYRYEFNYKSSCGESRIRQLRQSLFTLKRTELIDRSGLPLESANQTVFLDTYYSKRLLYVPASNKPLPEFLENIPGYDQTFRTINRCPDANTQTQPGTSPGSTAISSTASASMASSSYSVVTPSRTATSRVTALPGSTEQFSSATPAPAYTPGLSSASGNDPITVLFALAGTYVAFMTMAW